jgi:hypothetical protein
MSLNNNARPVLVRLKPEVDEYLRQWCADTERSLSWAVNQAVRSWLAMDPPNLAGELTKDAIVAARESTPLCDCLLGAEVLDAAREVAGRES